MDSTTLIVRHRAETKGSLGDTTAVVTTEEWGPCMVAPRYARESVDPTVAPVVVGKEIYGPPISLSASDEILIDGEAWRVDGRPADWAPVGVVVPVKRASSS